MHILGNSQIQKLKFKKLQTQTDFLPVYDSTTTSSMMVTGAKLVYLDTKPDHLVCSPATPGSIRGQVESWGIGWQAVNLKLLIAVPGVRHFRNAD